MGLKPHCPEKPPAHQLLHLRRLGHIHRHQTGLGAARLHLLGRLHELRVGARGQDQFRPLFGIRQGHGLANAPSSARNDGNTIVKLSHPAPLLAGRVTVRAKTTCASASTYPRKPHSQLVKVSTRKACILVTSRALWISVFNTVKTPRPPAVGQAASRLASSRFRSASVPTAVGGRMAPVTTTGLAVTRASLKQGKDFRRYLRVLWS